MSTRRFIQPVLKFVKTPSEPPNTSIGRVIVETTKNRSHGSCSRIRFGHPQADAIVGPNGVISSGHLIKVEAGARVRFLAADNNPYDFSVQRIAIPRAFIEATNWAERLSTDFSILHLAPLTGPNLSDVVPALPATLGSTRLRKEKIRKVGYIRVRNTDRAGLFETEGQFRTEFGGGRVIASDGVSTFGMSGGPALQRGRVVGVILGGYSAIDLTLSVRVHLSELENVVQWDLV